MNEHSLSPQLSLPLVSINLVFHKDPKFFEPQLESIRAQSYPNIEVNTLDTREDNIGFWAGQERLLAQSHGTYIICMSDVILDRDFVKHAIKVLEKNKSIGALQAKILQSDGLVDTTGFQIFKSRRIINRGKQTRNEYPEGEIFAVEGAVPVFRRAAIESLPYLIDPDFRIGPYGYGDDLDLAWRLHNRGWLHWYAPSVIAYHDRSTRGPRRQIPIIKRQLDWCNVRFAIIKNDAILSLLKDLPFWLTREIAVLGYMLIFEPRVLGIIPRLLRLLPRMIRHRYEDAL